MTKRNNENRQAEKAKFITESDWADATITPIAGDASTRSYYRLTLNGETAILMDAPPAAETPTCPPNASREERIRLGYNAMARLAGPSIEKFIAISEILLKVGLSAPRVFYANHRLGFTIIEDLGDSLYNKAITSSIDERLAYQSAIDCLIHLDSAKVDLIKNNARVLLTYDRLALEAETLLVVDWYWPRAKGESPTEEARRDYMAAWSGALDCLSPPSTLTLRDYHAENLLWLNNRQGIQRTGIIDFQDALIGYPAYDLVSLLEDARRDVAPELAAKMIDHYITSAERKDSDFDRDRFLTEYAILGAQRNAKILGIFSRLDQRDGKKRYAELLPRVEAHFKNNLHHPKLQAVQTFFQKNFDCFQ
ncbi:MAG: phosphotransferase [Parvularculaceae bacterium]